MNVQADLNLRWVQMSECTSSDVVALMVKLIKRQVCNSVPDLIYLLFIIQSTLVTSTSLFSNYRLSRSENLVPV